jgi:hypothetical protein
MAVVAATAAPATCPPLAEFVLTPTPGLSPGARLTLIVLAAYQDMRDGIGPELDIPNHPERCPLLHAYVLAVQGQLPIRGPLEKLVLVTQVALWDHEHESMRRNVPRIAELIDVSEKRVTKICDELEGRGVLLPEGF